MREKVVSDDWKQIGLEGLREIGDYFETHPKAISELGTDAVESRIDASYAAGNTPEIKTEARTRAHSVPS